jgi:hypothetical protein
MIINLSLGHVCYRTTVGEIIIDFPQTVTWSCWLWLIIIDIPQTLSLGHVCYRTTVGEIIIDFLQTVTWSCWLWLIIIDFPQT